MSASPPDTALLVSPISLRISSSLGAKFCAAQRRILARPEHIGVPRTSGRIPTRLQDERDEADATIHSALKRRVRSWSPRVRGSKESTGASTPSHGAVVRAISGELRRHGKVHASAPSDLRSKARIRSLRRTGTVRCDPSDLDLTIQIHPLNHVSAAWQPRHCPVSCHVENNFPN